LSAEPQALTVGGQTLGADGQTLGADPQASTAAGRIFGVGSRAMVAGWQTLVAAGQVSEIGGQAGDGDDEAPTSVDRAGAFGDYISTPQGVAMMNSISPLQGDPVVYCGDPWAWPTAIRFHAGGVMTQPRTAIIHGRVAHARRCS